MRDRIPCEFFLFRYVPDVVKGEFVNIGVLLREAGGDSVDSASRPSAVRFTRDWSRVRCIDAAADITLLEDLEQEINLRLGAKSVSQAAFLASLETSLSNSIQITEGHVSLAENLPTELEQLMQMYVEPLQAAPPQTRKKLTGRPAIQSAMRSQFERAGVWTLMNKRLAAERYTRRGDPLRIDCGYRSALPSSSSTASAIRMFHAVSLEGDVEMAKVLAFAAEQMREGVARIEGAALELTAVVEPLRLVAGEDRLDEDPDGSEAADRYRFGVETMEQRAIRVVTLNDLARVAATAQHDLGL